MQWCRCVEVQVQSVLQMCKCGAVQMCRGAGAVVQGSLCTVWQMCRGAGAECVADVQVWSCADV